MNAFAIYASVLTVVFALYYAFIYVQDLKKIKDQEKTDVEDIDVPEPTPDESPTDVEETKDGRYVIKKHNGKQVVVEPETDNNQQSSNGVKSVCGDKADDVINHCYSQMNPVKIDSECELYSDEMKTTLFNGGVTDAGQQIGVERQAI